jgi:KaiC/GvpD/RAD55 family RecA-like ATPase
MLDVRNMLDLLEVNTHRVGLNSIVGQPNSGKSTLAMRLAINYAAEYGVNTAFCSSESTLENFESEVHAYNMNYIGDNKDRAAVCNRLHFWGSLETTLNGLPDFDFFSLHGRLGVHKIGCVFIDGNQSGSLLYDTNVENVEFLCSRYTVWVVNQQSRIPVEIDKDTIRRHTVSLTSKMNYVYQVEKAYQSDGIVVSALKNRSGRALRVSLERDVFEHRKEGTSYRLKSLVGIE